MQPHNFPFELLDHHLCVLLILALKATCVFHVFSFGLRSVLVLALASTLAFLFVLLLLLFPRLSDIELLAEQLHIVIE